MVTGRSEGEEGNGGDEDVPFEGHAGAVLTRPCFSFSFGQISFVQVLHSQNQSNQS